VAQTLVQLGVNLEGIRTTGSLQTGVRLALTGEATKHRNTDILVELDAVLLMTVNPGFSGQRFIEWTVEKIRRLRRMIKERSLDVKIMVDGGVNEETMQKVVCAGAEILVMGYGIFRNPDPASVRRMLEGIECSC
jgi:ribulose-phosphate 3-epimerase